MNNIIKNLEIVLETSGRLQDFGSKRKIPTIISGSLNHLKNETLNSIIDYKDISLTKSQEINSLN